MVDQITNSHLSKDHILNTTEVFKVSQKYSILKKQEPLHFPSPPYSLFPFPISFHISEQ